MNHFRLPAIGMTLVITLASPAQQTGSGDTDKNRHGQSVEQGDMPIIERQLKLLTDKLALTGNQQARVKPILQELHDATQKLEQNKSLSPEERLAKIRPRRYEADKQIREILSDDQKKKLDEFEQESHPEMHEI